MMLEVEPASNSLQCRYTIEINACNVFSHTDEMIQRQPESGAKRGGNKKRHKILANYRDRRS